eukprot:scaffold5006_cov116-Isochrysis_galbana.AAC.8
MRRAQCRLVMETRGCVIMSKRRSNDTHTWASRRATTRLDFLHRTPSSSGASGSSDMPSSPSRTCRRRGTRHTIWGAQGD